MSHARDPSSLPMPDDAWRELDSALAVESVLAGPPLLESGEGLSRDDPSMQLGPVLPFRPEEPVHE